ncbi:polyphosphate kinase [Paenibacillus sp. PvR052]|nr:polyphosphate kinase [Paenibacillus sp. PvP091]MBP1169775.1 polyphosphate kinase [Paenibacillus sp. PvR098]MBP2440803.1 polyphosphate kinase [Paenibacillus sp. PvP052]
MFNEITGYSTPLHWKALCVAPFHLKPALFEYIRREIAHAKAGRPARIIAKMNALSHREMVDRLYEASRAGVKIDLLIRGICVLRPGVPGLSENITVRSIVDRFLEHSRVCGRTFARGLFLDKRRDCIVYSFIGAAIGP